jgi:glutathione peroxidase-family protein
MPSVHDFEATRIDGKTVKLDTFQGKAMLIVNTASACGFPATSSAPRTRARTMRLPSSAS